MSFPSDQPKSKYVLMTNYKIILLYFFPIFFSFGFFNNINHVLAFFDSESKRGSKQEAILVISNYYYI